MTATQFPRQASYEAVQSTARGADILDALLPLQGGRAHPQVLAEGVVLQGGGAPRHCRGLVVARRLQRALQQGREPEADPAQEVGEVAAVAAVDVGQGGDGGGRQVGGEVLEEISKLK